MGLPQAIIDYVKSIKLSDEQISKRREACNSCPSKGGRIGFKKVFPFFGWEEICKECGCYLNGEIGKIKAPKEVCPLGKWN